MGNAVRDRVFEQFRVGQDLGTSGWVTVTQEMIDAFGAATLDRDPMHVDPEWAAAGPFCGTIAFGFLTMSLLTRLLHEALGTDSTRYDPTQGYYLNYGFDRVRLITPVPSGSRVRGSFRVVDVRADAENRTIVKFAVEVAVEGATRPALAAEWLSVWVPPQRP
jgi:acyl dehydratase